MLSTISVSIGEALSNNSFKSQWLKDPNIYFLLILHVRCGLGLGSSAHQGHPQTPGDEVAIMWEVKTALLGFVPAMTAQQGSYTHFFCSHNSLTRTSHMVPLSHRGWEVQSHHEPERGRCENIWQNVCLPRQLGGVRGNDCHRLPFHVLPPAHTHPGALQFHFSRAATMIFFPLSPGGLVNIISPRD